MVWWMVYGLEMAALTERQQERLQVCEKNWVRGIAGVKRVNRRMYELREEIDGEIGKKLTEVSVDVGKEKGKQYCYGCGNSQNIIKVLRSVMLLSLCSDRFPHHCLEGIIRVIRAVTL